MAGQDGFAGKRNACEAFDRGGAVQAIQFQCGPPKMRVCLFEFS
jgi:hypothetical protein